MGPLDEVLDSTIVIDALNGWLVAIEVLKANKRRGISLVTWIEVMAGATLEDEPYFQAFLDQFTVLEITPEIAALAARFRRSLRLKLPDAVIFATAQSLKCPLLTRNTRDFPTGMAGVQTPYTLPTK